MARKICSTNVANAGTICPQNPARGCIASACQDKVCKPILCKCLSFACADFMLHLCLALFCRARDRFFAAGENGVKSDDTPFPSKPCMEQFPAAIMIADITGFTARMYHTMLMCHVLTCNVSHAACSSSAMSTSSQHL